MTHPRQSGTDNVTETAGATTHPSLFELMRVFGAIGLTSYGGGRVAYLWHEVARKRCWIAEAEVVEGIAITSMVPGRDFANLSVCLGDQGTVERIAVIVR